MEAGNTRQASPISQVRLAQAEFDPRASVLCKMRVLSGQRLLHLLLTSRACCCSSISGVRALGTFAAAQSHRSGASAINLRNASLTALSAATAYAVFPASHAPRSIIPMQIILRHSLSGSTIWKQAVVSTSSAGMRWFNLFVTLNLPVYRQESVTAKG